MNTFAKVMTEIKKKANPLRIQAFAPHGAPEDLFGFSVADMKVIAKKIKGEQELACRLYETSNGDATYFAGMVAHGSQMTKNHTGGKDQVNMRRLLQNLTSPVLPTINPASLAVPQQREESR